MRDFLLSLPPNALNFVLLGVIVVALLTLSVWFLATRGRKDVKERIERAAEGRVVSNAKRKADEAISLRKHKYSIPSLDKLVKDLLPNPAKLRLRLERTGRNISVSTYLAFNVIAGAAALAFARFVTETAFVTSVAAALCVGLALPRLVVGFLIGRRKKKFLQTFPDAIDVSIRGLIAGLPAIESMTIVGQEMTGPVAEEFSYITDSLKIGGEFNDVMWGAAQRIDLKEYEFFVITLSINRETGGNLGETLENLSDMLRKRRQVKLKIRALSSEAKASAYIIGSLPFFLFGVLYLLNPDYVLTLFTHPGGPVLVGAGATSFALGVGTMMKLVRFEI